MGPGGRSGAAGRSGGGADGPPYTVPLMGERRRPRLPGADPGMPAPPLVTTRSFVLPDLFPDPVPVAIYASRRDERTLAHATDSSRSGGRLRACPAQRTARRPHGTTGRCRRYVVPAQVPW